MQQRYTPYRDIRSIRRRQFLTTIAACLASLTGIPRLRAGQASRNIVLGLTPVVLSNNLDLLSTLKHYLETSVGRSVHLVQRRTYQEVTSLLISGQLDAAWICGYPFVAFHDQLELVAVPVWRGEPRYRSYLIAGTDSTAASLDDLQGGVHAFSDPNSNSGYLVTAALLAGRRLRPDGFFGKHFFTYGHRNVVRAVASGLADSGSVDGYVWEVLNETEPQLTQATRVIRKSEWLGFPPIAALRGALLRSEVQALQHAFLTMAENRSGQSVLKLLRLDGFTRADPEMFDPIAAKADLLKMLG